MANPLRNNQEASRPFSRRTRFLRSASQRRLAKLKPETVGCGTMDNEIISYLDMCRREGASLQKGMNYP